jgi:hypothetical protein
MIAIELTVRAVKWLETFVNGGMAQIMAISEDVQKLCKTLGSIDEFQGDDPEGDADARQMATFTLLQGIRRLAEDSKRRDRDSAHLASTMNGLVAALNEDMRKNAEMRNAYSKPNVICAHTVSDHSIPATESVLGVIERQRQDQERMLRTLANGKAYLHPGRGDQVAHAAQNFQMIYAASGSDSSRP